MADASQRSAFVVRVDAVGCILHHQQVVFLGQRHDGIHIAGHARIVHHHYHPRLFVYQRLYVLRCHVRVVSPAVGKSYHCPFADKRDGRRHKRVRRHYHLVARLQVAQHGAHLQRIRARRAEQTLTESVVFLKESVTQLGKIAVTRHGCRMAHLLYIAQFSARAVWLIKWNHTFKSSMFHSQ